MNCALYKKIVVFETLQALIYSKLHEKKICAYLLTTYTVEPPVQRPTWGQSLLAVDR